MAGQDFSDYAELNEDFADGVNDITRYLRKRNTGTRDEMAVDFTGTFTGIKTYEGKTAVPYKSVFTSEDGLMYQEGFREVYHAFKAEAIKNTLAQDINNMVPATIMKSHPHWDLYLDADSAAGFLKL